MPSIFRSAAFAALASGVFLLAACSTTGSSNLSQPRYLQELATLKVDPGTYARIYHHRTLAFSDVLELVRKGVPGNQIVAYLRSTRAPYNYSRQQINTLVSAGADSTLVNYLGRSQGDFLIDAQNASQQSQLLKNAKLSKEFWNDPYFSDPYYWGPAPFDYGWPVLW